MQTAHHTNTGLWDIWQTACQALGVTLEDVQRAALERFYLQLVEANQTTNLTRITAEEEFLYRHLLDSLVVSPYIPPNAKMADVGSGAGFPAIPIAIARPDVRVLAVESVGKKCQFIQAVQENLNLPNLSVSNERSETLGQKTDTREQFDVVTARAVAALPVLLELCLPLLKVGGRFLAMKGLSYEAELEASQKALKTLGGELKQVLSFPHPRLEGARVLVFEKSAPTPKAYPRAAGLPAKKPLH
jgi:16S rRNA (guanine527-N7)-methyltransferase